jgi:hypothetical protein
VPLYEGVVARLVADGKAEVVIRPGKPAIVGAPELTQRICHCATSGSMVRTEASNGVGAAVGDQVLLSREASVLMKNAVVLLGMPAIGASLGLLGAAVLFDGVAFRLPAMVVSAVAGLLLGLVMGVVAYRRLSVADQPVISRIITFRRDVTCLPHGDSSSTPACVLNPASGHMHSRPPRR